jgi:hypothetical protein
MPAANYQSPIFVRGTEECSAMLMERKNCHDELFHRYVERNQLVARIRDAFPSIYAVHRGLQDPSVSPYGI